MNIPRRFTRRRTLLATSALAATILVGACGSSAASNTAAPTPKPAATGTGATASSAAAQASPSAAQKVNANTAPRAELQQAFEAAGISGAARWSREVEEYRPYPTNDPSFAKLRQELAKYNPGPGVVDQIVATLAL